MAARSVSPGGALLRASRMFSLPAPIPAPPNDSSLVSGYHSDTSTIAFPTHQAITTLPAARKQGDWGLKRPLPLKSTTASSTPMLRIKAIDTVEHITDFASAADHGITLRKFQELRLPLSVPPAHEDGTVNMLLPQKSVFDPELDVTDIPPEKRADAVDRRWKFDGPWLAGMMPGVFKRWLAKEVRPRRTAFREYLRKKIASEKHASLAAAALEAGEAPPPPVDPTSVTDDQLTDYLRKLRHHNQALYDMVGHFLDLAPLKPPSVGETDLMTHSHKRIELRETKSPYAERGPPVTHPSAGLSYLRTTMYMDNHPLYGPQQQHPPVEARVLRPRRQVTSSAARLGLAGFVANAPMGDTAVNQKGTAEAEALDRLDPDVVGGAKIWVRSSSARLDSQGRVRLHVVGAPYEARLVAQELLGDAEVLGTTRGAEAAAQPESALSIRQRYRAPDVNAPVVASSARGYGLGQ